MPWALPLLPCCSGCVRSGRRLVGIADTGVTSLTRELGRPVTVAEAIEPVEAALHKSALAG